MLEVVGRGRAAVHPDDQRQRFGAGAGRGEHEAVDLEVVRRPPQSRAAGVDGRGGRVQRRERRPAGRRRGGVEHPQLRGRVPGAVSRSQPAAVRRRRNRRHPARRDRRITAPHHVGGAVDGDRPAGVAQTAEAGKPQRAIVAPPEAADVDLRRQHRRVAARRRDQRRLAGQDAPVRAEPLDECDPRCRPATGPGRRSASRARATWSPSPPPGRSRPAAPDTTRSPTDRRWQPQRSRLLRPSRTPRCSGPRARPEPTRPWRRRSSTGAASARRGG